MTELPRTLSRRDLVWFFVTAVVGLRWIATAAAVGPSSIVMWLLALAAFYGPLAFTTITLSDRYPQEGGLYIWTKHAFGDFAGFLTGWMYWMSTLIYFPGLLYFAAGSALFILDPSGRTLADSPTYFISASLAVMGFALALNLAGFRFGKWLHNASGYATWIPIALLIGMSAVCAFRFGSATPLHARELVPSFSTSSIVFLSTIAFGFGGFETAAFMGDEVIGGARTIRRAVIQAGAIIAAIYILGTIAVLVALPPGEVSGVQGIMQAIGGTAARVGASGLTPLLAALLTFGTIGAVSAWLGSTSRLPFVAGVEHALPAAFGRLHPRWGTPWVALIVAAIGAAGFACLGQAGTSVKGAYDVLVSLAVISYFIPYVLMFAALFRLDRRWHARALAGLGLAVTLLSIGLACIPAPGSPDPVMSLVKIVGGSVALLALGSVVYGRARARASRMPGRA
jgi:glutamate:GABA antiporter